MHFYHNSSNEKKVVLMNEFYLPELVFTYDASAKC